MRDAFVRALTELAAEDPSVMLVNGDLGFGVLTDFIGRFPTVAFWSQDNQFLRGSPSLRRRWLDLTLAAMDPEPDAFRLSEDMKALTDRLYPAPTLTPSSVKIYTHAKPGAAPGYLFLAPYQGKGTPGPMIADQNG